MWMLVVGPLAFALIFAIAAVDWDQVAAAGAASSDGTDFLNRLEKTSPRLNAALGILIGAVFLSLLIAVVLFPVFQAMMLRWWISGLRLGALTIRSQLRTGVIYGAYLRFLWYALLFSTAMSIVGVIAYYALVAALGALGKPEVVEAASAAGGVVSYVVVMLGYSAIYQGTVKFTFWRGGMESIQLEGIAALDAVKAEGGPSSAVGEGLADALNVGGF
jgi:hypothetical protein